MISVLKSAFPRGVPRVWLIVSLAAAVLAFCCGLKIGIGWADMRNGEFYVWRFSQYSSHLRALAEAQQITELTNAVILFDSRFNPRHDPYELQDTVFQVMKVGKYFTDTNAMPSGP
jgi:hypothetical protein